jgi:hypothetical protein
MEAICKMWVRIRREAQGFPEAVFDEKSQAS